MTISTLLQIRYLTRTNGMICALPRALIEQWGLKSRHAVQISFGHRTVRALIRQHFGSDEQVWMTKELAQQLHIPFAHRVLVKAEDNKVDIGPLVGIVTCDAVAERGFPFNQNYHKFFSNILKQNHTQKNGGYYFVFDVNAVNWEQMTVEGVFFRPDTNGWERATFPFPDVVYNKILSRAREKRADSQKFLEQLRAKSRAPIFNEKYFHKWDVYERLTANFEVAHLIPETHYNPTYARVLEMTRRYPMVYFKPVDGFMGLGIYQVVAQGNRVTARYRQKDTTIRKTYPSVQQMLRQQLPPQKRKNYVIQRGIDLAKLNGQPLDFRVHLNKNSRNEWEVTGVGAKVAGRGAITTHMKAGGKILSPLAVLEEIFPNQAEILLEQLKQQSIKVATVLDDSYKHPIGELGIDMGIDQSGEMWLFEVNSKPGRAIFHKIDGLRSNAAYCNRLLIDYSTHLAQFV